MMIHIVDVSPRIINSPPVGLFVYLASVMHVKGAPEVMR